MLNRVATLMVLALVLSSCGTKTNQESQSTEEQFTFFEGKTMGTDYHIKIYDSIVPQQDQIDSVLQVIDTVLSTYNPESYISHFNRGSAAIDSFPSAYKYMFHSVLSVSLSVYSYSLGAFDPSAAQLFNYWGFGENGPQIKANQAEFDAALANRGMDSITPNINLGTPWRPFANVKRQMQFNFNAVAKGYGVDEVASFLSSIGCENYMVEIGGEVYCGGTKPDSTSFEIGINTPKEGASTKSYVSIVELSNAALATSGNYRNFYVKDGKKYSHTIDPRSGHPVENNILSASVIAKDCATADAWATACMVLGVDSSIHTLNLFPDVDVYILYDVDGELRDTMSATFPRSE
jgi:thiamine biosynthesis lipoprotein